MAGLEGGAIVSLRHADLLKNICEVILDGRFADKPDRSQDDKIAAASTIVISDLSCWRNVFSANWFVSEMSSSYPWRR